MSTDNPKPPRNLSVVIDQMLFHIPGTKDELISQLTRLKGKVLYCAPECMSHLWGEAVEILERLIGKPKEPWEQSVEKIFVGETPAEVVDFQAALTKVTREFPAGKAAPVTMQEGHLVGLGLYVDGHDATIDAMVAATVGHEPIPVMMRRVLAAALAGRVPGLEPLRAAQQAVDAALNDRELLKSRNEALSKRVDMHRKLADQYKERVTTLEGLLKEMEASLDVDALAERTMRIDAEMACEALKGELKSTQAKVAELTERLVRTEDLHARKIAEAHASLASVETSKILLADRFREVMVELDLDEAGPDACTFVDGHADAQERAANVAAQALTNRAAQKEIERLKSEIMGINIVNHMQHTLEQMQAMACRVNERAERVNPQPPCSG